MIIIIQRGVSLGYDFIFLIRKRLIIILVFIIVLLKHQSFETLGLNIAGPYYVFDPLISDKLYTSKKLTKLG